MRTIFKIFSLSLMLRVNGALPLVDEWFDAFGIKKGKLFIPKKKLVRIW